MSNFSDKAKAVISTVAPILGGALGGPLGAAAGAAIAGALGGPSKDPKAVETALLSGDPEALLKLRQAENDFKVQMEQLGIEHEKLLFADTDSARKREMSVQDNTPKVLAYSTVVLAFGTMIVLMFGNRPTTISGEVLGQILGALEGALMLVLGYYFGSSAGSRAKTDSLVAAVVDKPKEQ
jgi:hypothetical protein